MRSLIVNSTAVLFLFATSAVLSAQNVVTPGQIAASGSVPVSFFDPLPALNSTAAAQKASIAEVHDRHDTFMNRLWIASMCAAAAATSADAATSWGKREGNALLASSDGTFGTRGLAIKSGIAAAVILPQILLRKHRELKAAFVAGNFAEAAIFTGAAVHNLGVPQPVH